MEKPEEKSQMGKSSEEGAWVVPAGAEARHDPKLVQCIQPSVTPDAMRREESQEAKSGSTPSVSTAGSVTSEVSSGAGGGDFSPTPVTVVEGGPRTGPKSKRRSPFGGGLGGDDRKPRKYAAIGIAIALACTIAPFVALRNSTADSKKPSESESSSVESNTTNAAGPKPFSPPSSLAGLDLKSIAVDDDGAVASVGGGKVAKLTLDPALQNATVRLLNKHKVPQASVVMIDPATGKVLVYASRGGDGKDLAIEANAPSASVFKVITGSALVQVAGVPIDTKACYNGGEQKIVASDLKDDPKHDVYCATLAQAMGRSINVIFAKLASRKLTAPDLSAVASQMGYGTAIPFDVPVMPSKLDIPTDPLEFARTAAGFWHTTLSPLHGALIASTVANGGVMMRPYIVSEVIDGSSVVYKAPAPSSIRKAIEPATAQEVGKMMNETVSQGTCYKAFHDAKGKSFIPGVEISGKTGTLNQSSPVKLFTWFVGFAPTKTGKVAIAVLVANDPVWKVKANVIAREVLQTYFAQQGTPNVMSPVLD